MRCPNLSELPPPPPGKTGWPWTVESVQLPDTMPNGHPWPRISIVTPSYNQGQYIEETIRSILLQGYPNLEYVIMDGGSTDDTVDIIRKYERWLVHWESVSDRGQAHAINKGLERCTGALFNWINSDDFLSLSALEHVGMAFRDGFAVFGACQHFTVSESTVHLSAELNPAGLIRQINGLSFQQPAQWVDRETLVSIGGLEEQYHYCFDYMMMLRYTNRNAKCVYIPHILAWFRLHPESKTCSSSLRFIEERAKIFKTLARAREFSYLTSALRRACVSDERWFVIGSVLRTNRSATDLEKFFRRCLTDPGMLMTRYGLGALKRVILQRTQAS